MKVIQTTAFNISLIIVGFILDQVTKFWAVGRFADANGNPTIDKINVMGEYFYFHLAYNTGAAFSMQPQKLIPFLSPTIFYALLSSIAITGLILFYKKLPVWDWGSKLGVALILSGAFGNLADRLRIDKVVDFISWDFPDINMMGFRMERWPTFNLADSWVCIGVCLIILSPKLLNPDKAVSK